jgi:putative ABC transport system ATP-binding protein
MNDQISLSEETAVAEKLTKHFKSDAGDVRAVRGVSFRLPRGKMVALRGPSGCGKSTLLNLIGALDKPDSGTLIVDGTDVAHLSGSGEVNYRRKKVGFAGGESDATVQARAAELLQRVGLPADRNLRRPLKLSGGEQQRVAIARALANDPPLLLADEPTANLDSATGALIIGLLRSLRDYDCTVLIATHDEAIANEADVILEMRDGQLVGA